MSPPLHTAARASSQVAFVLLIAAVVHFIFKGEDAVAAGYANTTPLRNQADVRHQSQRVATSVPLWRAVCPAVPRTPLLCIRHQRASKHDVRPLQSWYYSPTAAGDWQWPAHGPYGARPHRCIANRPFGSNYSGTCVCSGPVNPLHSISLRRQAIDTTKSRGQCLQLGTTNAASLCVCSSRL